MAAELPVAAWAHSPPRSGISVIVVGLVTGVDPVLSPLRRDNTYTIGYGRSSHHPGVEVEAILAQPAQCSGAGVAIRLIKIDIILLCVNFGPVRFRTTIAACLPLAGPIGAVGLLRRHAAPALTNLLLIRGDQKRRR